MQNIDQWIEEWMRPLASSLSDFVLYEWTIGGIHFPIIIVWLVFAAIFFTFYFGFINITGFKHSLSILKNSKKSKTQPGEISHFQALSTALSGTVGIGNIGGVAVVITMGGPGALFWLIVAGFLSMSTKFIECVLGVMYRKYNKDGSVSGGPMYYLERGLAQKGWIKMGKFLGVFYAISIVIGCLGIGNMFQSNQAYEQFVFITGKESIWAGMGWLFGLIIAFLVGLVILGGIKSIAKVTSRMVPFMAIGYLILALIIIVMNAPKIPGALSLVFHEAFQPKAMEGGMIGVMLLGFRRALFSNEAGLGSAAIAHSAVKTDEPVTEGYMGLLEPFIDTVVICSITALVILTTVYDHSVNYVSIQGVELTSQAFRENLPWTVLPLSIIAILFAFSTLISWSYYGLKAWTYLLGESKIKENIFKFIFCLFAILGCTIQLQSVLDFSDAMVYIVAIPNIIGLYILAPVVRRELKSYQSRIN